MEAYILQVIIFQLLFLLVYELLLKKETFFGYNRWYLLFTAIVSLVLPLIKIDALAFLVPAESFTGVPNVWLPEVFIGQEQANVQNSTAVEMSKSPGHINWWPLIYFTGVLVSLYIVFQKYHNLSRLFRFSIISSEKGIKIIEVPNSSIACTFYNTVFLGDKLSETERQQILTHELVHVKQKHSLDLVFFEVLKIIFWFNPLVYIYQNKIAMLHEFIADAAVVKVTEKRSYYEQLLNSAFNTQNISFINQFFNHSLIKKRIVMLQKSKSKTVAKLKYFALVPLMLVMLTYVACSEEKVANDQVEDSLANLSYTLKRGEAMSEEVKEIHSRYEAFLRENNPDFVSWATINYETQEISYSVHPKEEEVPAGYSELKVQSPDGASYKTFMNLKTDGNSVSEEKTSEKTYGFGTIEEVPVFGDCADLQTNQERKDCMSTKIKEHVTGSFNTGMGKELGLTGVNRIIAVFTINKEGAVTDIRARAPHPDLEVEAIRIISSLPSMTPGKQKGVAVDVTYSLPIVFQVGE